MFRRLGVASLIRLTINFSATAQPPAIRVGRRFAFAPVDAIRSLCDRVAESKRGADGGVAGKGISWPG
jgi:hypothetical protein